MPAWYAMPEPAEKDLLVGFYDITGYVNFARGRDARDIFEFLDGYFEVTAPIIEDGGGCFVKAIGDAGLFAFPGEETDAAIRTLRQTQHRGDAYLSKRDYKGRGLFKMHCGPVYCGPLGIPGRKPFDVIGDTVNIAATLKDTGFTMTPQVFRRLAPETRQMFKKHTPPVTYIALEDSH